jgi:tRNA 2-thiouridine synthesizing protein E
MKQRETLKVRKGIDDGGYLLQSETWTKDIARAMAQGDLTQDHWKVVDCLRQYYLEFDTVPPVRLVIRQTGLTLKHIHKLFPTGINQGACKIAGIPQQRVAFLNCADAA